MRTFTLGSVPDRKFVMIEVNGPRLRVTEGKSDGSTKRSEKELTSEAEARSACERMARALISRGFVEQTATCIRVHDRNMSADPRYMERAMLAGVRHVLADPVIAERARGRERFIRACMYVTIALNAYTNGRRQRSWLWLARALVSWPPQALDSRFFGALVRALVGPAVASRVRHAT